MKSFQQVLASAAKGDTQSLKEKASKLAQKAAESSKMAMRAAVTTALKGDVDESYKEAHDKLVSVHATFNAVCAALKHQGERAHKTGKTLRDTGEPLQDLASFLDPESRRSVRTARSAVRLPALPM